MRKTPDYRRDGDHIVVHPGAGDEARFHVQSDEAQKVMRGAKQRNLSRDAHVEIAVSRVPADVARAITDLLVKQNLGKWNEGKEAKLRLLQRQCARQHGCELALVHGRIVEVEALPPWSKPPVEKVVLRTTRHATLDYLFGGFRVHTLKTFCDALHAIGADSPESIVHRLADFLLNTASPLRSLDDCLQDSGCDITVDQLNEHLGFLYKVEYTD